MFHLRAPPRLFSILELRSLRAEELLSRGPFLSAIGWYDALTLRLYGVGVKRASRLDVELPAAGNEWRLLGVGQCDLLISPSEIPKVRNCALR